MDVELAAGGSRRQHLESVERQTGVRPEALNPPPFPKSVGYLWLAYRRIHAGRSTNGMGPSKATQLDIWAYQQNYGLRLHPWEVEAVDRLGDRWLTVQAEERAKAEQRAARSGRS